MTRKRYMIIGACTSLFITYTIFKSAEWNLITLISGLIIFCLVMLVFTAWMILLTSLFVIITAYSKAEKGILTEHTLTCNAHGVIEETSINRNERKWEGIYQIKQGGSHIYIYESPSRAHVIPKRIFRNTKEFHACYRELKTLFNQQHDSSIT